MQIKLKRGQITIFIILGLVIVIIFGIFFYISKFSAKTKGESGVAKSLETGDTEIVKTYAEVCLKTVSEDALFNRIGLYGGYINPDGDLEYGEQGIPTLNPLPILYQNNKVPYYLDGTDTYIPELNDIKKRMSNYIAVEFEKCFETGVFEDIGISIIKLDVDYQAINFDFSQTDVNVNVSLNKEDVSISFTYPLTIKKGAAESKLDSFRVTLPIRLKALYDSANDLVINTTNKQPGTYDISLDCDSYDKNQLTNVYNKSTTDPKTKIIKFVDFSTYEENYIRSYIFQFAVKNVNIAGNCVG